MQFDWYILGTILSGLSSAFFGCLVFFYNRSKTGFIFLAFSFAFSLWTLPYAIWLSQPDAGDALFWSRMLNLGAVLIPIFYIHWIVLILKVESQHKKLLVVGYTATILYALFSFSPFFINTVVPIAEFPFWPQANILYAAFLFTLLLPFFTYGIFLVGRASFSRKTDPILRIQSRYILIGSIMSTIGGIANFPLMFGIPFIAPQLTLLTIFHPMFWAYGSMRYKILNVKTIATEILVFGLWIFILARTIIFQRTTDQLIEGILLLITIFFGVFLIRSVDKEVEQREALTVANAGQENLIHIISHQIKGYLAKSRNIFAELLSEPAYGPVSDAAKPMLNEGFRSLTEGVEFTQQILNASNVEKGTTQYSIQSVDIRSIVESIVPTLKEVAEKKGLKFKLDIKDGDYRTIGDLIQMKEAFRNLIDNSVHYTPTGGITVSLARNDDKFIFTVQDTGVGIAEEDKPKLFTKGGRGADSLKININSTGYGLFFVKKVIEAHQGTVRVESEGKGKGSMSTVELPVKIEPKP